MTLKMFLASPMTIFQTQSAKNNCWTQFLLSTPLIITSSLLCLAKVKGNFIQIANFSSLSLLLIQFQVQGSLNWLARIAHLRSRFKNPSLFAALTIKVVPALRIGRMNVKRPLKTQRKLQGKLSNYQISSSGYSNAKTMLSLWVCLDGRYLKLHQNTPLTSKLIQCGQIMARTIPLIAIRILYSLYQHQRRDWLWNQATKSTEKKASYRSNTQFKTLCQNTVGLWSTFLKATSTTKTQRFIQIAFRQDLIVW